MAGIFTKAFTQQHNFLSDKLMLMDVLHQFKGSVNKKQ
jgi:hypothetical protein